MIVQLTRPFRRHRSQQIIAEQLSLIKELRIVLSSTDEDHNIASLITSPLFSSIQRSLGDYNGTLQDNLLHLITHTSPHMESKSTTPEGILDGCEALLISLKQYENQLGNMSSLSIYMLERLVLSSLLFGWTNTCAKNTLTDLNLDGSELENQYPFLYDIDESITTRSLNDKDALFYTLLYSSYKHHATNRFFRSQ
ncbi:hypothetical protein AB4254_07950 [Vibrio breoganii]